MKENRSEKKELVIQIIDGDDEDKPIIESPETQKIRDKTFDTEFKDLVQKVTTHTADSVKSEEITQEDLLKKFSLEANLPKLPRICPKDGKTRRQKVKEMIHNLQKTEKNANIRENIFRSLSHVNIASIP